MFYNNYDNTNDRPQGAFEIEMHAREMEKRYALMNYLYHSGQPSKFAETFSKAARRIGTVIGSLFM
jgi:hypothetical protein